MRIVLARHPRAVLWLLVVTAALLAGCSGRGGAEDQPTSRPAFKNIGEMMRGSTVIVRGVFRDTPPPAVENAEEGAAGARRLTTFEVTKTIKGQPGKQIRVAQEATVAADTSRAEPAGLEKQFFQPGAEYILFLNEEGGDYWVTGSQGAFRIVRGRAHSRNALGETKVLGPELKVKDLDVATLESYINNLLARGGSLLFQGDGPKSGGQ